jgi:ADP-ribose pyrophosphatase YjhB (NUDIX family)
MPDGGIVLARRAIEPGYGQWVFPGGYVDRGEEVRTAALREAREEAGIDIAIDGLVGIYSYPGVTPVIIVYRAHWTSGTLTMDDESSEIRTFDPRDLPWQELAFPSTRDSLRDYLAAAGPAPGAPGRSSG